MAFDTGQQATVGTYQPPAAVKSLGDCHEGGAFWHIFGLLLLSFGALMVAAALVFVSAGATPALPAVLFAASIPLLVLASTPFVFVILRFLGKRGGSQEVLGYHRAAPSARGVHPSRDCPPVVPKADPCAPSNQRRSCDDLKAVRHEREGLEEAEAALSQAIQRLEGDERGAAEELARSYRERRWMIEERERLLQAARGLEILMDSKKGDR